MLKLLFPRLLLKFVVFVELLLVADPDDPPALLGDRCLEVKATVER